MIRLTWVQPEDLVGHELRQATEDGRDPAAVAQLADRWYAAGGHPAPPQAGASPEPADPALRTLAERSLDELAALPRPSDAEPYGWDEIVAACPDWPVATPAPVDVERLRGAWLGRAAGCLLGKPVEKIPRAGIREIAEATGNWPLRTWFTARGLPAEVAARWPWNRRSAPTSLAENIDGMPEDDDLNYPMLALLLLERHGPGFGTDDVARLWLDELPAGRTFTAERVAYRNLLGGLEPPRTATYRNPFREWIGAQIRADLYGWVSPGDPARAARLAYADARLTHVGNGVYGAMFVAAACAAAVTGAGVPAALAAGLSVVPPRSRLAVAVRHGIELADRGPDWETVLDGLHASYGALHWVHAVNNAALVAAALTYGGGDFGRSVTAAVAGGWDTDSDAATVGSIVGATAPVPPQWTDPLRNRIASSVTGFDGIGFGTLAARTAEVSG
ncbi:ADP-ribosylglycohydrolase family protein [Actinocatenispora rupis]|uniref:ADP-ribosylglycohydrolase n=1 Tax=Actinocatenispora rupis TaxID=519421 RepID=A0A8J3IXU8_9ACTN|nr:ADP-ribosylglycohydrolase family protein [Actinocatenispora rupis]GID12056.1 hypothetical protein Aru02nite_29450 [Actinocatenispora rupis]